MSNVRNTSPTSNSRKPLLKKRKLPFSENITSTNESDLCKDKEKEVKETPVSKDSSSLTPRRNTPLSERQQIALLCRLSGISSAESSPTQEDCGTFSLKRNERGETPLHVATIKGDFEKVKKLLKQGANVNTIDNAGWTPLHEACNYGWYNIAKLLIEYDANVNAVGFDKFTPLHDAAINKHEKIVKLLLEYGANPLQENVNQQTPLDVARSEEIAEILRKSIDSKEKKSLKEESPEESNEDHLRSPEVVEKRQSEQSPCQSISALCELTMRKNSPQNQTHKGADNPTSPRLTLRFQSIRSRDDKSSSSAKVNDISSLQPKYQSYCVTMETKGDVYDFRKEDATVSSTQCVSSTSDNEGTGNKCEAVTSTCKEVEEECEKEKKMEETPDSEKSASVEKMDTSDSTSSKVNGGRLSIDFSVKDRDCVSDAEKEKEEVRRKRRKSSDSSQSRHSTNKGHKSPSSKNAQQDGHTDQRSPKTRKRGSQSSSDTESNPSDAENHSNEINVDTINAFNSPSAVGPHSPKVPPLKIVIPSGSGSLELETRERNKVSSSKQALPYVVNTTTAETIDTSAEPVSGSLLSETNREATKSDTPSKSKEDTHPPEERFQRVTRSSQRMQAAMSGGSSTSSQCNSIEPSTTNNVVSSSSSQKEGSGESSNDEQMQIQIDVHPRKRKLRQREIGNENTSQNPSSASSSNEDSQQQQQQLNSYQMFANIRKQVDKRRKSMFSVHPKPPQGYKNYLLNRCSYVLEGNAASRLSVPMISAPQSLEGSIKELFISQEKERYRLRLQHLIEREKLVLSAEQEILRVHGRAARAMVNQSTPLSVCSVLKDKEIYNDIEDDKDKNVRSRYNGRLFLSWLQDTGDKWKKIKDAMLLRHHNEAESLHAVQKLAWTWKMKELAMCDMKTSPVIDDIFVPMVHVSDDFKLLPSENQ
ncbi:ankyrin repeat domain-containing protein 12 [Trichonephila clavata]|uniref:Ankyrin repeat domain-containing protein 12 n=1 Tax=Trichonephila clavata TaxID=2740835 RepID=A0A8X6LL58_TRICU|nr:ankyrin repeat domain-containing protein 12 [Trichonephila clavata]